MHAASKVKGAVRRSLASRRESVTSEQAAAAALNITKALRRSLLRRRYLDLQNVVSAVRRSVLCGRYLDYSKAAGTVKGVVRRILFRRRYLDHRIEVSIWTCGSREKITFPAFRDSTVQSAKEDFLLLAAKTKSISTTVEPASNAAGLLLVCCSHVIADNATLAALTTHMKRGEKVWAVFRDVWQASPIHLEEFMLFQSMFAFQRRHHAHQSSAGRPSRIFLKVMDSDSRQRMPAPELNSLKSKN